MITWGILATMTAAVVGEKSFFAIRFLLGMAEGRSLFHLLAPEELPRAGDSRDVPCLYSSDGGHPGDLGCPT
jgi:hypothetical protein